MEKKKVRRQLCATYVSSVCVCVWEKPATRSFERTENCVTAGPNTVCSQPPPHAALPEWPRTQRCTSPRYGAKRKNLSDQLCHRENKPRLCAIRLFFSFFQSGGGNNEPTRLTHAAPPWFSGSTVGACLWENVAEDKTATHLIRSIQPAAY